MVMRKFKVLLLTLLFALGFLLGQLYLLKYVPQQRKRQFSIEGDLSAALLRTITYENVKSFTRACEEKKVAAVLIDPHVLRAITKQLKGSINGTSCQYFCQTTSAVTFGILLSKLTPIKKLFLQLLKKQGFEIASYFDRDSRLLSIKKTLVPLVPTHILMKRNDHLIHLVVFQKRISGFWWSGSFNNQASWTGDQFYTNYSLLKFGQNASAFDEIQVVKVKMDEMKVNAPRFPIKFLNQIPTSSFIECNHTRAQQFYQMYPKDENQEALLFRKNAKLLINTAKNKALDPLNIPFWLSSGTCLGWFRQCDTFPYSKDIDFGVPIKDYDVRLIAAMQRNNMPLKHIFGKPEDSLELSFQSADIKLDMFFFYNEKEYMWNGGTQARTGKKFKYLFPNFTLCWTEFLEMKLRIPCETEAYIEANYGKNWFHPVKQWDWKKSPPNVKPNGKWPDSLMDQVVQQFDVK